MVLTHAIGFQAQAQTHGATRSALGQLIQPLLRLVAVAVMQRPAGRIQINSIAQFLLLADALIVFKRQRLLKMQFAGRFIAQCVCTFRRQQMQQAAHQGQRVVLGGCRAFQQIVHLVQALQRRFARA